ncbi:MAG: hypothetical protein WKG07_07955 [Hymenobacter sp.]
MLLLTLTPAPDDCLPPQPRLGSCWRCDTGSPTRAPSRCWPG